MTLDNRISGLAKTFPTLRSAPGVAPWCPTKLDSWAASAQPSTAAVHAARFVLSLWDNRRSWQCGSFDLVEAMRVWDKPHVDALGCWLTLRWLP